MKYQEDIRNIIHSQGYVLDQELQNGLANIVVKLKKGKNFFVLKYYLRDFFKKDREEQFMILTRKVIPLPSIIESGHNYLIMNYVGGYPGTIFFTQNSNKSYETGKKIGNRIKQLHALKINSNKVGFLGKKGLSSLEYGLKPSPFKNSRQFLSSLIQEQIQHLQKYKIKIPAIKLEMISIGRDHCLIHHDVDPKNTLFEDGEIAAFLDLEYALIGSILFDIAKVNILGRYFAYHTLGVARHLDFNKYIRGFYEGYENEYSYEELRPYYIYVLLNYILFWVSHPAAKEKDKLKILPIHFDNLNRLINHKSLYVPPY